MLLIKNGLLYTMEENKPRKADVLIKDGKIEEIADFIAQTKQMQVLDAKDKRVFPGFIDAHSHIAITINAAEICRVDARLGSLKKGKDADIVIYDGSPLEISSSVFATIINGEVVWSPSD